MANPMSQMNSYYPGAAAAYRSLSAARMAAAAAAAAAQQNAIAGLANTNSQQVKFPMPQTNWNLYSDRVLEMQSIKSDANKT